MLRFSPSSFLKTAALGCLLAGAVASDSLGAMQQIEGKGVLAEQDAETARVERFFSAGARQSGPAPKTWSSRPKVRWHARWQNSPRYVV